MTYLSYGRFDSETAKLSASKHNRTKFLEAAELEEQEVDKTKVGEESKLNTYA